MSDFDMSTPIPLSGSQGGAPIYLDTTDLPGKLIHRNPADSGTNHVVTEVLVINPGTGSRTLWGVVQGPGAPVPTAQDANQMPRIDVYPAPEGHAPRLFYTPFVLGPGYSFHVSVNDSSTPGQLYMFGTVETFPASGVMGYGGLVRRNDYTVASIASPAYVTLDFEAGLVTNPVNIAQEPGNNRISLNATGVWFVSAYGTFTADKTSADRSIFTRFYNETDGAPITSKPFPAFVENQSNNAVWSYTTLIEVPEALVGKFIRLEFGGSADAFASVIVHKTGMTFARIAPEIGA